MDLFNAKGPKILYNYLIENYLINDYFMITQTPTYVLLDNDLKIILRTSDIQKLFTLLEI